MYMSNDVCVSNCTGVIDNISLVFSGYDPEQVNLYKATAIHLKKFGALVQTSTSRNGYRRNYKYKEDKFGGRVLVSVMPVKPNAAPLRLEFNPAKLGAVKVSELIKTFSEDILYGGLHEFYERARVTRIDVAFDLYDLDFNDAFFWCKESTTSQLFSTEGMRTETIVFNRTKLKKIVIYDKAREQKAKGMKVVKEPWTRVEVRKRSCGQLRSIKGCKNPMPGFYISSRDKPEGIGKDFWMLLNAACGPMTLQAVLSKFSPTHRATAKEALSKSLIAAWNSEKVWSEWPGIVNESGLLELLQIKKC